MTDFSDESINAAHKFVVEQLNEQLRYIHTQLAGLREAEQKNRGLFKSLVIMHAQDFRDESGFEVRWDLTEDKHKHKVRWRTDGTCALCGKRSSHPNHIFQYPPE